MTPPDMKPCWDDNENWFKAVLIGYEQIREREEVESNGLRF